MPASDFQAPPSDRAERRAPGESRAGGFNSFPPAERSEGARERRAEGEGAGRLGASRRPAGRSTKRKEDLHLQVFKKNFQKFF